MTEKFLSKPPPRYVYDIIMNTMKATGYPKGLYNDEETIHTFFEEVNFILNRRALKIKSKYSKRLLT